VKSIIDFWPAKGSWKDKPPMMFHVEVQYAWRKDVCYIENKNVSLQYEWRC
jgi:hypothetical protein